MTKITREVIIEAAKQATIKQGSPISRRDFIRISEISNHQIYKLFPNGSWAEAKRLANLEPHPHRTSRLSDDDLLVEFHRIVTQLNQIPTWAVFDSQSQISVDAIRRRFGGIQRTLKHYKEWLLANQPNSSIIKIVDSKLASEETGLKTVSPPTLQISSEIVEQALGDAEQLIRTQGAAHAVDRVHTALHGYLRTIIEKAGLKSEEDASITKLFKILRENHPKFSPNKNPEEINRIINSMASIIDSLNPIRNNSTLAHPRNMLLEEPEAMLVINSVRTMFHYLNSKLK